MILLLLIALKYSKAIDWNLHERDAVLDLSKFATKAVYADIGRKADQIYSKFEKIMHPLQKKELNKNSVRIKQAISNHLYQKFGDPVKKQIPYVIKASVEKASDDINLQMKNIPSGVHMTDHQSQMLSYQISLDMAQKTQSNLKKDLSRKWNEFEKENREGALKEHGLSNYGNSLGKRDFLDNIRQRFKFFQIDPETQWWIPQVISLVLMLFTFAILLPEMTLAIGIWQTILQFGIIQPILNKLFLGYYFYDEDGSHVGTRITSPGPIFNLESGMYE